MIRPLPEGKTHLDRIEAYRRFVKAHTELERARREFDAAMCQAYYLGWPAHTLARLCGLHKATIHRKAQALANGRGDNETEA